MPHITSTPLGGDRAVVAPGSACRARPLMRQEAVLAHQPQDAAAGGADAGKAQPTPGFAAALPGKAAAGEHGADRLDQRRVWHTASRLRCRDIRPPRPSPTASVSAVVSVVMLITPVHGYRPLTGCLSQL